MLEGARYPLRKERINIDHNIHASLVKDKKIQCIKHECYDVITEINENIFYSVDNLNISTSLSHSFMSLHLLRYTEKLNCIYLYIGLIKK